MAPVFLFLIAGLLWLHRLRALLGAVGEGRVFTHANARRLSQMGAITLGMGLAWPMIDVGRARLLRGALDLEGARIVSTGLDYTFLLMGLLLLTLAAVWRYGIELEEDRQLTV